MKSTQSTRQIKENLLLLQRERLRRLAASSLHEFVAQAWHVLEPTTEFSDNWHIAAICEHLEAVTRGEIRRLLINVPPRTSKSTVVSVIWPAWTWINNPSHQWLCGSHNADLAGVHARKMRLLVTSDWYQERWSDRYSISKDQSEKTNFENDKRGYRISFGMRAGITGYGGDGVVVDDPHSTDDARSDTERKRGLTTFDESVSTRLNSRASSITIVMQRLHENDLSGHVLGLGDYEQLLIPMHYDPKRSRVTVIGWKDPREESGVLLDPLRFPVEYVTQWEQTLGSYGSAGQLEQRPAPEGGGILKQEWFRFYFDDELPAAFDEEIQSWDCAVKDTTDYVCGLAMGRKGATVWIKGTDVYARLDFPATIAAFRRFSIEYPTGSKLVEDKANGPAVIATLKGEIPGIIAVNPDGDKEARARAVSPYIEAGNVKLPSPYDRAGNPRADRAWVLRLLNNCASFPNAEHDDDVDALTQGVHRLLHGFASSHGVFEFYRQSTEAATAAKAG